MSRKVYRFAPEVGYTGLPPSEGVAAARMPIRILNGREVHFLAGEPNVGKRWAVLRGLSGCAWSCEIGN